MELYVNEKFHYFLLYTTNIFREASNECKQKVLHITFGQMLKLEEQWINL